MDFCKKKTPLPTDDPANQYGEFWLWTAIDVPTRLIVAFRGGARTLEEAKQLLTQLATRLTTKPLFVSDELAHYADSLAEAFHTRVSVPRTGRRGRPCQPRRVLDADLDYATVHKTREKGRVVKVERRVVYGTPERIASRLEASPSHTINTAYIERSNLDWRLWDAHLVRKAVTFAKSVQWLLAKFALSVTFYNCLRPHESLSRGADRKFRPCTPAMAASITDHVWTVKELLTRYVRCQ
jgi:IS1 family transposase